MIKFLLSVFSLLLIQGCGAGVSDINQDLPNNYIYVSEAPEQKWIAKKPLSVNSNLYIPCRILKYKYDKRYIIAKIRFHYDQSSVVGFIESKALKEGKNYYYIIDTENNLRYGPYQSKEEFIKEITAMDIGLKF